MYSAGLGLSFEINRLDTYLIKSTRISVYFGIKQRLLVVVFLLCIDLYSHAEIIQITVQQDNFTGRKPQNSFLSDPNEGIQVGMGTRYNTLIYILRQAALMRRTQEQVSAFAV